jgi:hypothetical protein
MDFCLLGDLKLLKSGKQGGDVLVRFAPITTSKDLRDLKLLFIPHITQRLQAE